MWCCYCVKSELFCPRCLNEQLFAAPLRASNVCDDGSFSSPKECASALSRPRDVALRLLSKRLLWLILPVPGALVLSRYERTWQNDNKKNIRYHVKGKNCRQIKVDLFVTPIFAGEPICQIKLSSPSFYATTTPFRFHISPFSFSHQWPKREVSTSFASFFL